VRDTDRLLTGLETVGWPALSDSIRYAVAAKPSIHLDALLTARKVINASKGDATLSCFFVVVRAVSAISLWETPMAAARIRPLPQATELSV
jgi:hypothetical protein